MGSARHALVTGGGRGIGAAIASALVAAGHHVTITGRDAARLADLAAATRLPDQGRLTIGALSLPTERGSARPERIAITSARTSSYPGSSL